MAQPHDKAFFAACGRRGGLLGGRRGGLSRSPKKIVASKRLIAAINSRRRARLEAAKRERDRQVAARDIQRNIEAREPTIIRPQPRWPSYRRS